ncbi:MAG: recombination mediator RecR [Desulfovibrionaceae bacterium]|nr:recombination mediator RecR [Desulfovibrionaceae bacterium]
MAAELPAALAELVRRLGRLPGMGPKSALRVAMTLLDWPEEQTRELGTSIATLRDRLHLCRRCGGLSSAEVCPLCADPSRRTDMLCLVADWDSQLNLERGGFYNGQYLILGGLVSPLDNGGPDRLNLDRLKARLAEGQVRELIFALGATIEAENTASWIQVVVQNEFPDIRVTRLAQGIPLGSEVRHMDAETLRQSLKYRQELS